MVLREGGAGLLRQRQGPKMASCLHLAVLRGDSNVLRVVIDQLGRESKAGGGGAAAAEVVEAAAVAAAVAGGTGCGGVTWEEAGRTSSQQSTGGSGGGHVLAEGLL